MTTQKQVFQASSRFRWNAFKWISRLVFFFLALMIPVVWIALANVNDIFLPGLSKIDTSKNAHPALPKDLNKKEKSKYHGYDDFLTVKHKNSLLTVKEN